MILAEETSEGDTRVSEALYVYGVVRAGALPSIEAELAAHGLESR